MMNESRKNITQAIAWLVLAVGMMFTLSSLQSKGEALERMTLSISSSNLFFSGIGLALIAAVTIAILSKSKRKKM